MGRGHRLVQEPDAGRRRRDPVSRTRLHRVRAARRHGRRRAIGVPWSGPDDLAARGHQAIPAGPPREHRPARGIALARALGMGSDTTKILPPPRRGPRWVDLVLAAVVGSLATVVLFYLLFVSR